MTSDNPYRGLPKVDELASEIDGPVPRPLVVDAVRAALEQARRDISAGREVDVRADAEKSIRALERSAGVGVINATGVLLHTNLGRARWSADAIVRAGLAAASYHNLELDIETGQRSRRGSFVTALLRALTVAEDALVVNNNAAALLLALAATSAGRAVPVARGELIEIGGSYRLPAVVEASGSQLVEVGTTNRTRVGDYETALQLHRCGAILKVHPSNYRIEGFAEEAGIADLADLAHAHDIPLVYDVGSGLLDATTPWLDTPTPEWLRSEPAVRQSLEAGADLVTFSGDKLLGGPQAGIIVGSKAVVRRLADNPLTRALRVDGVTYAALAATLHAHAEGEARRIPFWAQALATHAELAERANSVAERVGGVVTDGHSMIGAGSVPGMTIPTPLVVLPGLDDLYDCLLAADTPVLGRREEGSLILDLRTVEPAADDVLVETIDRCR